MNVKVVRDSIMVIKKNIKQLGNIKFDKMSRIKWTSTQKELLIKLTDSSLPNTASFAERYYWVSNKLIEYPKCLVCDNEIKKWHRAKKGYSQFCSVKCSNSSDQVKQNRKISIQNKYNVDSVLQLQEVKTQIAETRSKKYGNSLERTEIQSQRWLSTLKTRYGDDYNIPEPKKYLDGWETMSHRERMILSNNERYGVDWYCQTNEYKEQFKNTCLKKYGVPHHSQKHLDEYTYKLLCDDDFYRSEIKKTNLTELHMRTVCDFTTLVKRSKELKLHTKWESSSEVELRNWIIDLGLVVESNTKKLIWPHEIDIYIPKLNIAIEFNGLYWHSEKHKDKNYHQMKTNKCYDVNIKLIHIWEDDWLNKKDIIKSRILAYFGMNSYRIYGRKCIIQRISKAEKNTFLTENHAQGADRSTILYGLYHNTELVSVMTFAKARYNNNYDYELVRYCLLKNVTVLGGAAKLLKSFIADYPNKTIISYADRSWGDGDIYNSIGFEKTHTTPPNYHYVKNNECIRLNRMQFQKSKLQNKLEVYDENISERENMSVNGYYRIYNCGHAVWVYSK